MGMMERRDRYLQSLLDALCQHTGIRLKQVRWAGCADVAGERIDFTFRLHTEDQFYDAPEEARWSIRVGRGRRRKRFLQRPDGTFDWQKLAINILDEVQHARDKRKALAKQARRAPHPMDREAALLRLEYDFERTRIQLAGGAAFPCASPVDAQPEVVVLRFDEVLTPEQARALLDVCVEQGLIFKAPEPDRMPKPRPALH